MQTRMLQATDAEDYQRLRLRSLEEHPEAFGQSVAEESGIPLKQIAEHLTAHLPDNGVMGIFHQEHLTGIIAINRHPGPKTAHRAYLGGMYVVPEQRGHGFARVLVQAALDYLRQRPGVEDVVVAVTTSSTNARQLYRDVGFQTWGVDPRYIKVGDTYYDIEWMILPLKDGKGSA